MQKKPSNTREQCAFDRGAAKARSAKNAMQYLNAGQLEFIGKYRESNPHKKGSPEHQFWNEGFDSAQ